jgi:cytochrome c5
MRFTVKLFASIASLVGVLSLCTTLSVGAASSAEEKIIERIKPAGHVCLEGDDSCGAAAAPVATAGGARSGEDVYNASCSACHSTGVAGAPKFGTAEWAERGAKGIDSLLATAISGINAMPPKGTCANCSDDELKGAIEYMVNSAP